MLFSNQEIANFINDNFEPCWKSVRDVPTVSIDFGNGKKLKRTLHDNIATFVCHRDGKVIDVLPGVYDPVAYKKQLEDLKLASEFVLDRGHLSESKLLEYHHVRAETIKTGRQFSIRRKEIERTISGVEKNMKIVLSPMERLRGSFNGASRANAESLPAKTARSKTKQSKTTTAKIAETLNGRLAVDTKINETHRRQQIHGYILQKGLTTPDEMHKWLYREVLHADLDDPYMGLRDILFENYPFQVEDESSE